MTPAASETGRFLTDVPPDRWTAPADVLALPRERLPRHIAMIMDGNGRWATQKGQARVTGHARGAKVVPDLVGECCRLRERLGAPDFLTLYSFSLENWKRPQGEVDFLMGMYIDFLRSERPRMMRENVRFNQVGRAEGLPASVLDEVNRTLEATAGNDGLVVTLALNYSSRAELADACRAIAEKVAVGDLHPAQVDEELISAHLYTAGTSGMATGIAMPDVDLLVRTAGELRVSNYLLWQISYAELWVTETLWPDFGRAELFESIRAFATRTRRYGALDPAVQPAGG